MTQHSGKPAADIEIDESLVRSLLREQHPDLADLPLRAIECGWDNALFRLGDALVVRLPRRAAAKQLIEHEQRWLPELAAVLPIPVPAPVRVGRPAANYPWRWSIVPWLRGCTADLCEPRADQAERLAAFLRALHQPAPVNAPVNPFRGVPLRERADAIAERMDRLARQTALISDDVIAIYRAALDAPVDVAPTWLHGDLHAGNLLVDDGVISGVIDWGDLTCGDRATDLATLWMNLGERAARQDAMRAYGHISDATWLRAKGWAIFFGVMLGASGLAGDARHALMARRTLERVVAGP